MYLGNKNIRHIESRWSVEEMKFFQNSTKNFIKEVFDLSSANIDRDFALVMSHTMVRFNRLIFKAACLKKIDLTDKRLFVELDSSNDVRGEFLNSPWGELLFKSKNIDTYKYPLKAKWVSSTTKGVPFLKRLYIAGIETIFFRIATLKYFEVIQHKIFQFFKNKNMQVLIPNENELLIETSYNMLKSGVMLKKISVNIDNQATNNFDNQISPPKEVINLLRSRLNLWVIPELIDVCLEVFDKELYKSLNEARMYKKLWSKELNFSSKMKSVLFINAPSTLNGIALTSICRKKNIPVVAFQHGVTKEICKTHGEMMIGYESNYSDLVISYNDLASEASNKSYYAIGPSVSVGMSNRHLRMKSTNWFQSNDSPIVYVSTNLYKGNIGLFGTYLTDYHRSVNELNLISEVFLKVPHKILYKTYPENYQRYADGDPIVESINKTNNIELFNNKTDMRYSVSKYRIFITSKATSTLGWLVMTGKPVIFINWDDNMPLTDEAYKLIKKGLFLFDGNAIDSMNSLKIFLSKPIEEIESLWAKKNIFRQEMITQLFSSYRNNSGSRAASIIKEKFFN